MIQRGRLMVAGVALAIVCGGGMWMRAQAQGGATPAPMGKITPWAAMKIANGKVPGHVLNANFEYAEGHWVYAVMVVTNTTPKTIKEVEIDPTTGKIGDTEDVTPEDEAKETADELNKALGNAVPADAKEAAEKPEKATKGKKSE